MYNYNFSNWLSYGFPVMIPTVGTKRWDGSRWVSSTKSSTLDDGYSFDAFGEGGLDGGDLSDSFGTAAGMSSGISSAAGDRAADAMVGAFGQAALGAGAKTGLGMAFGMNPSDAFSMGVQGLASPGTMGGIVGAGINGALGLSSLGPTQAALAGLASLAAGPIAGAVVGMFGGFVTNAIADALDARDMEQTRDLAEDAFGHGFQGLSIGKDVADRSLAATSTQSPADAALSIGQALADNGLATSVEGVRGAYGAVQNDVFGELAANMSPLSAPEMAALDSFGVLGGLAQENFGISAQADTTTQGGKAGAPTADAPNVSDYGGLAATAPPSLSDLSDVDAAVDNALAAAAEASEMGDTDSDGDPGGGNGDPGDPNGGMGDPSADGLNGADPSDTGADGFGSSDPGAAGVGSGSVGGL